MNNAKKITPAGTEVIEEKSIATIPENNQVVKSDAKIDAFISKRQEFITKVNAICVEGKDYHVIQGKKSLAKGGAEKIASIFHWTAKFDKDQEALDMLGDIKGLVAFKCTLTNGQVVGEGRGAALLTKNGGDPNKTLKMAQKSAFIDAVLRSSGLSDFYTQDLEDMPKEQIGTTQYTHGGEIIEKSIYKKPSPAQAKLIKDLAIKKHISQVELNLMAKGKNPSELIKALLAYQTKQEELPVIQQEATPDVTGEDIPF